MAKVVSVGLACLVGKLIEVLSQGKHKWGDNGILQTKMEESLSDCKPKTGEQCHSAWEYVSVFVLSTLSANIRNRKANFIQPVLCDIISVQDKSIHIMINSIYCCS